MDTTTPTTTYKIEGMTCNHCVANVEKNLNNITPVDGVEVDLQNGEATVSGNVPEDKVKEVIESIGYQFKGKKG